jgi:hypothetical protein
MSTITQPRGIIPQSIRQRVSQLRAKVISWLLIDGTSKVLLAIVLIALLDLGLDRFFRMDLAQRTIMLVLMVTTVLGFFWWRLIKPFFYRPNDDALILEIEAHNRDLRESMISSAQLARVKNPDAIGMSTELMNAAIHDGNQRAEAIDVSNVLNRSRWGINIAIAVACVLCLGAMSFGVATSEFWKTWFNRNILLKNDQWPQNTILIIQNAVDGVILAPRGEDLDLTVIVDENSPVTDVEVFIEREGDSGRSREKMTASGQLDGREHHYVFFDLMDEFRFRARAGFDTTDWVQVRLVDPPMVEKLDISVRLPKYTGIEQLVNFPGSGPYTVMEGSDLIVRGKMNKQLTGSQLRSGARTWPIDVDGQRSFELEIPADELDGGKYRFDLQDDSGFQSSEPSMFEIKLKEDDAPKVLANYKGVTAMVTPIAMIPISFSVEDEFSVTGVQFEYQWNDSDGSIAKKGAMKIDRIQDIGGPSISVETPRILDLRDLNVPVDVGLRVVVSATDNNTLDGPKTGVSREFLFRVVTEQELHRDLIRREVEQRKAFEQAIKRQEELKIDMMILQTSTQDIPSDNSDSNQEERLNSLISFQRRQSVIETNVYRINEQFVGFVVEANNNRIGLIRNKPGDAEQAGSDEKEQMFDALQNRMQQRIIEPLNELNRANGLFSQSDQAIEACSRSYADLAVLNTQMQKAVEIQGQLITEMKRILNEMEQTGNISDIVSDAIEVKRAQESVKAQSEKAKEEAANKDIFDNDNSSSNGNNKKSDDKSKKDDVDTNDTIEK